MFVQNIFGHNHTRGKSFRSGLEEVDEAEIFEGAENRLTMNQTYTLDFHCNFDLKLYPFDTQVTHMNEVGPF